MKVFLLVIVLVQFTFGQEDVQTKQQTRAMSFTYQPGATAAYPTGTGLIYKPGTTVDYIAGVTLTYVYTTTIKFEKETEVYRQNGPETYVAGSEVTFPGGTTVTYGPGSSVYYTTNGETRYGQFNGNTHAIASYPKQTSVEYYYGSGSTNLILYAAGSNPLVFYNPGGSTRFGVSGLPVEKHPSNTTGVAFKTYGYYGGGGGYGYSYCSGYSYNGWPSTTYYNSNYGYRSSCYQTCYNCYSYTSSGGSSGSGGYYYGK